MSSFYGGKEGRSFVIAKTFPSISEMATAFAQGYNYSDVKFDEYVLINTEYRDNPENGRIYRRGYDFDNTERKIMSYAKGNSLAYAEEEINAGGAEYIGTIVGPAGRAPAFNLGLYDDVSNLKSYEITDPNAFEDPIRYLNNNSALYEEYFLVSINGHYYYYNTSKK